MNLFNLHTNPEELLWFEKKQYLPSEVWKKVEDLMYGDYPPSNSELKKYEKYIKNGARESLRYAQDVLYDRFPAGEPAIALDPYVAWKYVLTMIDAPWPEAEPAIASDPHYRKKYQELLDAWGEDWTVKPK